MRTRTTRARITRVAAGAAVAAGAVLALVSPVSAEGSDHDCGFLRSPDDGPVSDPIHHYVEPLVPATAGGVHYVNCNQIVALEYVGTSGWVIDVIDQVNWIAAGNPVYLPLPGDPAVKIPPLPLKLPGGRF
jgi:hypothetical protein